MRPEVWTQGTLTVQEEIGTRWIDQTEDPMGLEVSGDVKTDILTSTITINVLANIKILMLKRQI